MTVAEIERRLREAEPEIVRRLEEQERARARRERKRRLDRAAWWRRIKDQEMTI